MIDQPAKEPESYWIKFPDNSILRRTRSMIKARSQPSYFELEAEGKEWNSTGIIPPCSHQPFNSMLPAPELPALPMDNLVPPPLTTKATLLQQVTFLSVPPVQFNLPSQAVVQQLLYQALLEDPLTQLREFHHEVHSFQEVSCVQWNIMEASGKATFISHSVRTYIVNCAHRYGLVKQSDICGKFLTFLTSSKFTSLSSIQQLNLISNKGE